MKWFIETKGQIIITEGETAKEAMIEAARITPMDELGVLMVANTKPVFDTDEVIAYRTTAALVECGRVTKEWAAKRDEEIMAAL